MRHDSERGREGGAGSDGRDIWGLDIAFNNAGAEQKPNATADIAEEEWDRIIAIDLLGVFVCMKYEIPLISSAGEMRS